MAKTTKQPKLLDTPLDILLPYQKKWVLDGSRFKIGMQARQTGKSFGSAAEVVIDSKLQDKNQWVILSTGERQALEWLKKAKMWVEALDYSIEGYEELRDSDEALLKQAEIVLPNGSSIIVVPANPRTVRGYDANLLLDEFAHQESPDAIWKAIYPSITNPLRGKKKLRIISTPNGKDNKFYNLWAHNKSYSKHLVNIYDAIKQGLPLDPEELREALDDEEAWQQEYLCEFLASSTVLLPYELIEGCEDEASGTGWWDPAGTANHYIGIDIGRKRDLTVAWVLEDTGTQLKTVEVIELTKTPFNRQQEILGDLIKKKTVRGVEIDATGIGAMLAEELARLHGSKVNEFTFTNTSKGTICLRMQKAFESKKVRIPKNRTIREDLHSIQRLASSTGQVSFSATRNEDGHADRAMALALALEANSKRQGSSSSIGRVNSSPTDVMERAFKELRNGEGLLI